MSGRNYTPEEFDEKADYEGGYYEVFQYGLDESDVSDEYPAFQSLVRWASGAWTELRKAENALYEYLAEGRDD